MTNDEIERIAESLGAKHHASFDSWIFPNGREVFFDPYTNWADTGLVLEAYLKLVIDDIYKDPDFDIHSVSLDITGWHKRPKEAICQAYLSSIEGNRS